MAVNISSYAKALDEAADYRIRYWVAQNPNTPAETLIKLASDKEAFIRWRVAQNPNLPEAVRFWLKNPDFAGLTLEEFIRLIGE